jgi:hypothetical protein
MSSSFHNPFQWPHTSSLQIACLTTHSL